MQPGAILAAAIEVLDEQARNPGPLDLILQRYVRARRYIGSKDRTALGEHVFGAVRRQGRLDWRLRAAGAEPGPRARILADAILTGGATMLDLTAITADARYGPPPLTAAELGWLGALGPPPLEGAGMPPEVAVECPIWAWDSFQSAFGDNAAHELAALREPAPLDLRVNTLKTTHERALADIRAAGFDARGMPYAPLGIRLNERVALGRLPGLLDGAVDPQDEGSQLVAMIVDAQPGESIVDYCAGAGGKTLALAADMQNKGRLYALDTDGRRLERSAPRYAKAGVDTVQRREIATGADPWLKRRKRRFDRVLVDAPCTGVGAWRRNPDARWSRKSPPLSELVPLQAEIFERAARLVRPGGRIVYATCSMLPEENEAQVEAFMSKHPEFQLDPPERFPAPLTGPYLKLTPAQHGCDGFFAAALTRAPAEKAD
jgi:16S rRNA (cytosine967-C5)-methyltransferase